MHRRSETNFAALKDVLRLNALTFNASILQRKAGKNFVRLKIDIIV